MGDCFTSSNVALRVLMLPAPVINAHVIDVLLRLPTQQFARLVGRGVADGDVARAALHDVVPHGTAVGGLEGTYSAEQAISMARAQIDGKAALKGKQAVQRRHMAQRQVNQYNRARASAIRRGVVVAEHVQYNRSGSITRNGRAGC